MKPSVGRIVHYVSYGTPGGEYTSQCRAAIVSAVHWSDAADAEDWEGAVQEAIPGDGQARPYIDSVSLVVLNPTGLFFNEYVPYCGNENRGGTWHWPERVDE